jgi:hypothetical protein
MSQAPPPRSPASATQRRGHAHSLRHPGRRARSPSWRNSSSAPPTSGFRGTHSRSRIETFSGAGGEHRHTGDLEFDADHPAVLVGADAAPTPVEFLLHAIASCITSGLGNIAAARGIRLTEVESTVEGDIDLRGIFGFSEGGAQRLQPDARELPREGGRAAREAARTGRAVEGALGGVRRAHQRHRGPDFGRLRTGLAR